MVQHLILFTTVVLSGFPVANHSQYVTGNVCDIHRCKHACDVYRMIAHTLCVSILHICVCV